MFCLQIDKSVVHTYRIDLPEYQAHNEAMFNYWPTQEVKTSDALSTAQVFYKDVFSMKMVNILIPFYVCVLVSPVPFLILLFGVSMFIRSMSW